MKYVYVLRDTFDRPLYVGCSQSVTARLSQLRAEPWWTDVSSASWQCVPDEVAAEVEQDTIRKLNPRHNKAGRTAPYSPPATNPDAFAVTVHQAAEAIPLSVSMVRKLIRQGVIATVPHTGSRVLIARTELERYVNGRAS